MLERFQARLKTVCMVTLIPTGFPIMSGGAKGKEKAQLSPREEYFFRVNNDCFRTEGQGYNRLV